MSDAELAYLAGHFDGEGCIYMTERKNSGRCRLRISVTCSYEPVFDQYIKNFGGKVRLVTGTRKQLYRWELSDISQCCEFFVKLLPFLQEKSSQARVALDYLAERKQYSLRGYSGTTQDMEHLHRVSHQTFLALRHLKI